MKKGANKNANQFGEGIEPLAVGILVGRIQKEIEHYAYAAGISPLTLTEAVGQILRCEEDRIVLGDHDPVSPVRSEATERTEVRLSTVEMAGSPHQTSPAIAESTAKSILESTAKPKRIPQHKQHSARRHNRRRCNGCGNLFFPQGMVAHERTCPMVAGNAVTQTHSSQILQHFKKNPSGVYDVNQLSELMNYPSNSVAALCLTLTRRGLLDRTSVDGRYVYSLPQIVLQP